MSIGVVFRLVWLKIKGTGLGEFCSICQGRLFSQQDTYDCESLSGGTVPWHLPETASGLLESEQPHCKITALQPRNLHTTHEQ